MGEEVKILKSRERVAFVELLRIVACFLVIVNHTNSRIFLGTTPSTLWVLSLSYFFVCKIAVPLFVMIAGYIMLDEQASYKKIYSRFLRIALCLLLFSGIYYIFYVWAGVVEKFHLKQFLLGILWKPITNAFWYLYLYLGILLMLPFLQKMVSNMQKKDFYVFFLISGLFFGTWPMIVHYFPGLNYSRDFILPVFNSYISLLLLGCFIKRYCEASGKWGRICLIVFGLMCALNVGLTYREYIVCGGSDYLFFDNRVFLPIVVASVCVFYAASTLRFSDGAKRVIVSLGKLTFGIYLVSDFIIWRGMSLYHAMVSWGIYPMVAMVLFEVIVFAIGALGAWVLKKLPVFRRLL